MSLDEQTFCVYCNTKTSDDDKDLDECAVIERTYYYDVCKNLECLDNLRKLRLKSEEKFERRIANLIQEKAHWVFKQLQKVRNERYNVR